MKKGICIFVSRSKKPDLYVNILSYCIAKYGRETIQKAYLLNIVDHPVEKKKKSIDLEEVKHNITSQTISLTKGNYQPWDSKKDKFARVNEVKKTLINSSRKYLYEDLKWLLENVGIETQIILSEEIEQSLFNIIETNNLDFIFDVTGVITRHLIRVSLTLLSNEKKIFAFEMNKNLDRNEDDLIHNLESHDYDYHKLNVKNFDIKSHQKNSSIFIKKDEWFKLIASGNSDKVIIQLFDHMGYNSHEIISLSSRYNTLQKNLTKGIIKVEESGTELNKINHSLIKIISEF